MSFDEQNYATTDTIQIFESVQSNVSFPLKTQITIYIHTALIITVIQYRYVG